MSDEEPRQYNGLLYHLATKFTVSVITPVTYTIKYSASYSFLNQSPGKSKTTN